MRLFVRHPARTTRKKRTPLRTSIDLSAFLSVMLVLLFIVMFGNVYPTQRHSRQVDIPMTTNSTLQPAALREDALVVVVTRDGSLLFRNTRITPDDLPDMLRDGIRSGANKTVYIKVDAHAKYLDVKTVLDQIRQSGLQNVTFLSDRPAH